MGYRYSGEHTVDRVFGKCWALLFMCTLALAPSVARAVPTLRVLVFADEGDEFVRRLRGQTADLAIDLVISPAPPTSTTAELRAQLQASRADLAVWLDSSLASGSMTCVFDQQAREIEQRPIGSGSVGTKERSAQLEVAALILRSALVERLNAAASGASTAHVSRQPVEDLVAQASPVAVEVRAPRELMTLPAASVTRKLELALGARAMRVAAGRTLFGIEGTLGVTRKALGAALSYTGTFRDNQRTKDVSLGLREDRLAAMLHYIYKPWPYLQLRVGLDLGAISVHRHTTHVAPELSRTKAQRSLSLFGGPRLALHWASNKRVGAALSLGVDVLSAPTRYTLKTESLREVERLYTVAPWIALSVFGRPH